VRLGRILQVSWAYGTTSVQRKCVRGMEVTLPLWGMPRRKSAKELPVPAKGASCPVLLGANEQLMKAGQPALSTAPPPGSTVASCGSRTFGLEFQPLDGTLVATNTEGAGGHDWAAKPSQTRRLHGRWMRPERRQGAWP